MEDLNKKLVDRLFKTNDKLFELISKGHLRSELGQEIITENLKALWAVSVEVYRASTPLKLTFHNDEREKIADPSPPPFKERTKLEKGKWYKAYDLFIVYQGEGEKTYGFSKVLNSWVSSISVNWDSDQGWTLATNDEIKGILIDEAWTRYEGKKIKVSSFGEVREFLGARCLVYVPSRNALCAQWDDWSFDIFRTGEWAQAVDSETKLDNPKKR